MNSVGILKQSLNFYGRLFNKIFWLSVATSIMPLLMIVVMGTGQASLLGLLFVMAISMFFSIYMLAYIHQFSKDQDDSLASAFNLTLRKFFPVIGTSIVFGLATLLAAIPGAIIGGILAAGLQDEQLKISLTAIFALIPMSFVMYRCFFAVYFTLTDGTPAIEALKMSNQLTKKNRLIFRALMLLSAVMLVYILLLLIVGQMIAVGTMAIAVLEFALQVIIMPFFTIFIYRLYEVSKANMEADSNNQDSE